VTFNEVAKLFAMQVQHSIHCTHYILTKLFAMQYSWSGNASHLAASVGAYDMLEKYDMQPHGVNSADEDMNGISPGVATETCDVSDFMVSLLIDFMVG
jgi:hypothetical protein